MSKEKKDVLMYTFKMELTATVNETKTAKQNRRAAHWRTLNPDESERSDKSIATRWDEMTTKYR
jgi:hypothetical protein